MQRPRLLAWTHDDIDRRRRPVGPGLLLLGLLLSGLAAPARPNSICTGSNEAGAPGAPESCHRCDVDRDGDIDLDDVDQVVAADGVPATGLDDPRDPTSDVWIDGQDEDQCRSACTVPHREPPAHGGPPPPNHRPLADAGPDQVAPGGGTVTLDGSGSSDLEGDPLRHHWKLASRPDGSRARLSDKKAVMPIFVADRDGEYVAELVVHDCRSKSEPDQVTIVAGAGNVPPVAVAGPDQTVDVGAAVQLDGSGSSDANGDPLQFAWSIVSAPGGSAAVLDDPAAVMPGFVADLAGTYVVALAVDDGQAASALDTVEISTVNTAPVADAGAGLTVHVTEVVTLDGSGSSDADGDPLTFHWALLSSPVGSAAVLSGPTSVNPSFLVDLPGDYVVQLIVNDGFVDSAPDTVTITTGNSAPVADAGPDQVTFVGDPVQLDGSGSSDVDGDPLTFAWAFQSLPAGSAAVLSDPSAVNPTFQIDLPGSYVIQLIVDDGAVSSAPDTVVVTTENRPPVADAGADQTVSLGAIAQLDGSGSGDPDADPLGFAWSLVSVPAGSGAALSDPNAPDPTFVADLPGAYIAQLIVSDGLSTSAPDTVMVSTENSIPIADAGADQTVTMGATVVLDGSASADPDGTPLDFFWSLLSRPAGSSAALSDAAAVDPAFVADLAGLYVAQLIVGDGVLVSDPDAVMITAEEPVVVTVTPTDAEAAEAGPDPGMFTIARTGSTVDALTVFYSLAGSAANGTDYEALAASAIIPSGAATADVTLTPIDDAEIEEAEFAVLLLRAGPGYGVGTPGTATVTIADDDVPVVTVAATDSLATEAGPTTGTFTFSRTGDPGAALDVIVTRSGTAGNGDYASLGGPSFLVTIPAGQAAANLTLTPLHDNLVEGDETVNLTIDPAASYTVGTPDSATVTIADDPPVASVTAPDPDASEAGPDPGVFTFARSGGDLAASLTVSLSIGGTAANSGDYAFIGGNVVIPAGETSATVTITPSPDNQIEGAETVVLTILASATYIVGSPDTATVTIADSPTVVTVEAGDLDASEAGLDPGLFTFTRGGGNLAADLQVIVSRGGTATNGVDYASVGGANFLVTIPAGEASFTLTITPLQDSLVEGSETVVLTIQPRTAYIIGVPGTATVTIADDD